MKIITKYMMRSLVPNYFVGLSFFTVLMLINQVFIMVKYVVERNISIDKVSRLFMFSIPFVLAMTIPMAVVMASVLTFGRMSMDSEVVALRGSGISLMRIVRPNLFFGLGLFFIALVFFDTILPWGNTEYVKMRSKIFVSDPMADFGARQVTSIGNKSMRYERENVRTRQLYNIFITSKDGSVTFARRGEFIDKRIVQDKMMIRFRLYEVSIQERDRKNKGQLLVTYAPEVLQTFFHDLRSRRTFFKSARTMTISELVKKIRRGNKTREQALKREQQRLALYEKKYKTVYEELQKYKKAHPKEFLQPKAKTPKVTARRKHPLRKRTTVKRTRNRSRYGAKFKAQKRAVQLRRQRRAAQLRRQQQLRRQRRAAQLRRQRRAAQLRRQRRAAQLSRQKRAAQLRRQRRAAQLQRQRRAAQLRRQRNLRNRRPGRVARQGIKLNKVVKNKQYYQQRVSSTANNIRNAKTRLKHLRNVTYNSPIDIYELHKKFSLPFACFIFTLIGAPLGMFSRRSGKSVGLGFCLLVVIAYYFCLVFGKSWVLSHKMTPVLAAWLPDLFLGALGVLLVIKKLKE